MLTIDAFGSGGSSITLPLASQETPGEAEGFLGGESHEGLESHVSLERHVSLESHAALEIPRSVIRRLPREKWERCDPDALTALADKITTLSARLNAESYRLLALIAEFDRLEGWKREGFASCAGWLAYRTVIDKGTARERVRVAKALTVLPRTSEAMARGELSFSQVRAITRAADAECEEELLEHARTMSAGQLEKLVRSWKRLGREDGAELEARIHDSRTLSVFPDDEGAYLIRGRVEPHLGALLMRAIEAASDALYRGSVPETTPEQRRADALMFLVERAMEVTFIEGARAEPRREDGRVRHPRGRTTGATTTGRRGSGRDEVSGRGSRTGSSDAASREIDDVSAETSLCNDPWGSPGDPSGSPGGEEVSKSGILGTATDKGVIESASQSSSVSSTTRIPLSERHTVILHVDAGSLRADGEPGTAHLEDGTRVSAETARRIACDAGVIRVHETSAGQPRELEGKRRTAPMRLRRALEIRDRGCRFPGCGSRFTQAHHIQHWADGGATQLANLVSLCAQHHRLLHEGGFELEPDPARPDRPIFYSPRGIRIPEVPPRITLDGVVMGGGERRSGGKGSRLKVPRWEDDLPLAFYLRALETMS